MTLETVILVRHARSLANRDPAIYLSTPDHTIPLCQPDDDAEAIAAAELIRSLALDPSKVCSWRSSYLRCKQTESLMVARAFGDAATNVQRCESFLLREQEYGDWDGLSDEAIAALDPLRFARRQQAVEAYPRFYFRQPNGESRADVAQRTGTFIERLRHAERPHHIVFLHAITQRAFRMVWFDRSVEWFHGEPNPPNASVVVIERDVTLGGWREYSLGHVPAGTPG